MMNRFRPILPPWKFSTAISAIALLVISSIPRAVAQAAPDYQVIRTLTIQSLYSRVIQDPAGNLYGTTYNGGNYGSGTVFKLAPDGSGFTILHSFDGADEGGVPFAGLTFGSDGKLYGTTMQGGANDLGTVYGLAPDGSGFTVLHSFDGANDGATPYAELTLGSDGKLYGATANGGTNDSGTIFSLAPNGSGFTFTVLQYFDSASDGAEPYAALIEGSGGNLYGTTTVGGADNAGTVYNLAPNGSGFTFTVLHAFGGADGGATPLGGVTLGGGGNLYGTTAGGGAGNSGIVYSLSPNGSGFTFTVLHSFDGAGGGSTPYAGVTLGSGGNLYGTTISGGADNFGTAYRLATDGSGFTVLQSFYGSAPFSTLTEGSGGNLYGTTMYGGIGFSTVYKIAASGSEFTVIHSFDGIDKAALFSALTFGTDGNLYGTSGNGGSSGGYGTVYKIDPSGSAFSLLHSFNMTDGATLQAGLTLGANGKFYGTAVSGGQPTGGYGTVFEIDPSGTPFTLLYRFLDLVNGGTPIAGLTQGGDGNLYGAAVSGGANQFGAIYRIAPSGSDFVVLHSFDGTNDGAYPYAALTAGPVGDLYGTSAGSASGPGTVYKLALDGSGFTVLHSFDGADGGASPAAALLLYSDGNFYGTTVGGGTAGKGTVYRLAPDGSDFAVLHSFDGANDGAGPFAALAVGVDGNLYGTTRTGGSASHGTVFQIAPDGTFAVLHSFDYTNGGDPYAGLTPDSDGNFYGTTMNGAQGGVIYRICLATCTATTLTGSLNPSTFGSSVTFTATVSGTNPTGTVTFKDGGAPIGTAAISGGHAAFTTSSLSIGAHSITATYGGDANYSPSSSKALNQVVNPGSTPSTTTLKSHPNPSQFTASVSFTATVTGNKPTGTVTFRDDTVVLGTATIKKGKASFATRSLSIGTHSITAGYSGDSNNAASTSGILKQTVKPKK